MQLKCVCVTLPAVLLLVFLQVIPCVIMAAIAHPFTSHWIMFRVSQQM